MYGKPDTSRLPSINNYKAALNHFNSVKPWRTRPDDPRPIASRKSSVQSMRQLEDGSIAFRLYRTDVVTWHPDNSFTLIGYPSQATGHFAWMLTPDGVYLQYNQGVVFTNYRWVKDPVTGKYGRAKNNRVAYCDSQTPVRLIPDGGDNWAVDEASVTRLFDLPVVNRKITRELSKEYRLADFKHWLTGVSGLSDTENRMPLGLEHITEDLDEALYYSHRGDFPKAWQYLPHVDMCAWGRSHDWQRQYQITPASIEKVREHLYAMHDGAITYEQHKTVTLSQWERIRRS